MTTRRTEELLQLRSEVEKLIAQREESEAESSLRVTALHEEKAAQHATMNKMLGALRKQLSESEVQLRSLQREREQEKRQESSSS